MHPWKQKKRRRRPNCDGIAIGNILVIGRFSRGLWEVEGTSAALRGRQ